MAAKEELAQTLEEGTLPEDKDTFSFDEWLSISGLTALKDILIKHNMTKIESLSTESNEFAAFISDPLLLPRAMLIPQAIQSFQSLQNSYKDQLNKKQQQKEKETPDGISCDKSDKSSSSSSDHEADIEKTKEIIAKQNILNVDVDIEVKEKEKEKEEEDEEGNDDNNNDNNDDDDDVNPDENDPNSLYYKFKQYKKDKAEHRKASRGSIHSVSSLISVDEDIAKLSKQRKLSKPSIIREKNRDKTEKKKRKMVKLKESDCVRFINNKKKEGIVRFIGETEFGDGIYYGVELIKGNGDCDGSVDDVSYFECDENKGVFVKRKTLRRIAPKNRNNTTRKRTDSMDSNASYQSDISDIDGGGIKISKTKRKKKKKKKKKNDINAAKTERNAREKYKNKVNKKKKKRGGARPATLGAVDFSAMFNERTATKKKDDNYYKKMKQELKKQGPREIGKIKYKGIKTKKKRKKNKNNRSRSKSSNNNGGGDVSDLSENGMDNNSLSDNNDDSDEEEQDNGELFGERTSHYVSKTRRKLRKISSKDIIAPKLGPREIGKIKYNGLKLTKQEKKELENSTFLEDNLSHKTRKLKKEISYDDKNLFGAKLGPQEIGKIKYKGTKLTKQQKEDLKNGKVLGVKLHHVVKKKSKLHRRTKSMIGSKLGPLDMGKNSNYKGTKLNANDMDDGGDILSEKTHIVTKKKWQLINKNNNNHNDDYNDDDDDDDEEEEQKNMVYVEYDDENVNDADDVDDDSNDDDSDANALSLRPKRKITDKDNNKNKGKSRGKNKQRIKPKTPRKGGSGIKKEKRPKTPRKEDGIKRLKSPRPRRPKTPRKPSKSPRGKPAKLNRVKSSPSPSPKPSPVNSPISSISSIDADDDDEYERMHKLNKKRKNKKYVEKENKNNKKKENKKDKKKKHKKKKKGKQDIVNKYKKKLISKNRSNPVPRHYASESDQEYIENVKNNIYEDPDTYKENEKYEQSPSHSPKQIHHEFDFDESNIAKPAISKAPRLVQSKSISPKRASLIASPKDIDITSDDVRSSPHNKQEHVEIAHYVHDVDTSESDTDIDDNGSLNALSSSDEDDMDHNLNKTEKKWI